jgi:hypothetical protein
MLVMVLTLGLYCTMLAFMCLVWSNYVQTFFIITNCVMQSSVFCHSITEFCVAYRTVNYTIVNALVVEFFVGECD